MIILAAKQHQSAWYKEIPKDWVLAISDNGWTTNDLGILWLKEVFDKHTKARSTGAYRMIILDGHGSHATAGFDHYCTENKIIPVYLPPHSSHLLQPLDVGCFSPLKVAYGRKIQDCIRLGINHINKTEFLHVYQQIRHVLSTANIRSGFLATGLVPYDPKRVLDKLQFRISTPNPEPIHSSQESSSWTAGTPQTTRQLEKQSNLIKGLWRRRTNSPSSPIRRAVDQVVKGCQIAMQNAVLLDHEIKQLREANKHQKRKREIPRSYIATGGILTGEEGQRRAQEASIQQEKRQDNSERPRQRAPQR
ncbi:hypothetical protein PHISCL_10242, partial [Aspergillus sclerotialis]